jgi:DNA-binding MarR family transcriptional regulator
MIIRDTLVFRTLLAIARQRPDYDELRSHALLELLATAESVRSKVKFRLQEFSLSELQFSTLVVLLALDPEPVLPTTLATHTSASRATMTDILDHLLARGYIERQRSKEDRRNYLITLTDAGRSLADRAEAALLQSFAELGRPLTEPAPRALLAICDKLAPRLHFTAAS